jgi:hypothetical protein
MTSLRRIAQAGTFGPRVGNGRSGNGVRTNPTFVPRRSIYFKQGIGQFEPLTLVRPRIKNHPGTRSKTFDFRDIVHTQSTAFV